MAEKIIINPVDNVEVMLTATTDVLGKAVNAGHKIALADIKTGEKIIKYGYPIGAAKQDIKKGEHVHVHNVKTLLAEGAEYTYNPEKAADYIKEANENAKRLEERKGKPTIEAFKRANGAIGIRNEIWIVPTVGCVNKTAELLANWANAEFGGDNASKTGIDGVYAWIHPYGCSQMGDDHATTRTILADLVKHPNAAAVLVLGLGCENNTVDAFKEELHANPADAAIMSDERVKYLVTQKVEDEITEGKKILKELAGFAGKAKRETVSVKELVIGMKCGGSDGLSGITANAIVGQLCDTLSQYGGSVILTEVPEMFGAEQMLMDRCVNKEVFDKTVDLVNNFKHYFTSHNQVVYENPSPGNKDGGITTLEDKSLGCVQKGGKAPVCDVYKYGERLSPSVKGLQLLEGPGNDIVSTTALTAAGAHIILFTTGRGTPLGAPAPTIKIASNSALAEHKKGWIDFDAGAMLEENPEETLDRLFDLICDIASGKKQTRNEINNYREIAIFKNGVTL